MSLCQQKKEFLLGDGQLVKETPLRTGYGTKSDGFAKFRRWKGAELASVYLQGGGYSECRREGKGKEKSVMEKRWNSGNRTDQRQYLPKRYIGICMNEKEAAES